MTATENLRRLLDERGVEWHRGKLAMLDDEYTQWWVSDRMEGFVAYECDYPLNTLIVRGITPEQAIAATLGSCNCPNNCTDGERTETCHDKNGFDPELGFECTVCGAMTDGYMLSPADMGHYRQFNFCPMCGRRIEQ